LAPKRKFNLDNKKSSYHLSDMNLFKT